MYFTKWIGLAGSIFRSPAGPTRPQAFFLSDVGIDKFVARGEISTTPLNLITLGPTFKIDVTRHFVVFASLGFFRATYKIDAKALVEIPGLELELEETFDVKRTGGVATLGAGFWIGEGFHFTFDYTFRVARWEDFDDRPVGIKLYAPDTIVPFGLTFGLRRTF